MTRKSANIGFFPRDAFFSAGGYDEHMVAYEEHDLHNRLLEKGSKIARVHDVSELNIGEPASLLQYVCKYYYYYYGRTISAYANIARRQSKIFSRLDPRHATLLVAFSGYGVRAQVVGGLA